MYTLTALLTRIACDSSYSCFASWPVDQCQSSFNWYSLPQAIQDQINQIDHNVVLLGQRLDQTFSRLVTDILSHTGKRYVGEYYTPLPLAQHLIDLSGFQPAQLLSGCTVVDPACGGGIILTEIAHRVVNYTLINNLNQQDAFRALDTYLYGFDIQPFAVVLTKTLLIHTCLPLLNANLQIAGEKIFNNIQLLDPLPELEKFKTGEKKFDFIIANPPYLIDAAKRTYRHGGGELGNELSLDIVDTATQRLNAGGTLLLYTGVAIVAGHDAFLAVAEEKLKRAGFTFNYSEIDPDIFGEELLSAPYNKADRIAAVVLTARKNAA